MSFLDLSRVLTGAPLDFRTVWCALRRLIARLVLGITGVMLLPITVSGQTFVQLTDLGSNVGPRLTRLVAQQRLGGRSLFGRIGTKVSFINQGAVYQFAGDPEWSRILIGLKDQWIREFTDIGGPGGRVLDPGGIDISARRNFYVADHVKARVVLAVFDPGAQNLVSPRSWSGPFPKPVDLAWDGQASPLSTDYLYVLDDSLASVTYWNLNSGIPAAALWSYGNAGTGIGQFLGPSGICVGKTPSINGGTQFTTSFYVVDRGNRRLVWLTRNANGATWTGSTSIGGWDPTDCAVDHFGNVYVVDHTNHRLHKLTSALTLLASYGAYGMGLNNLNTFAFPHAISVPCGLKVVNNQTVWYCEGRMVTAEQWSDSSGAVEHYLGLDAWVITQPSGTSPSFSYVATDHAYNLVKLYDANFWVIKTFSPNYLLRSGTLTFFWDGYKDDGTPAPSGNYSFSAYLTSAYGCSGQSWCQKALASQTFYYTQTDTGGTGGCAKCTVATAGSDPTTLFLRQRVLMGPRPVARLSAPLDAALQATGAPSSSLTEVVRQYGVRGLAFSVTRSAAAKPVNIRVYAMSGRLVRVLVNQQFDPGVYEVGWDGNDDRGRPVAPGVYIAMMTVGSFRATQHLILRQP